MHGSACAASLSEVLASQNADETLTFNSREVKHCSSEILLYDSQTKVSYSRLSNFIELC